MCWEDIEIGRKLESIAYRKPLPADTLTLLASADTRRTRIGFANAVSVLTTVAPQGVTPQPGLGFNCSWITPPLLFTIEEYGQLVCGEWYGITEDNPGDLLVTLQTLRDKK